MKSRWDWLLWASCLASGFFLFQYPTWTQWCFGTCFVPIYNWGIYKLQREHSEYTDEVLNHFLDGFLLSRIGSNMLLDQHPNYKEGFAMISCFFKVLGKSLEHCAAVFGALQFFSLSECCFLASICAPRFTVLLEDTGIMPERPKKQAVKRDRFGFFLYVLNTAVIALEVAWQGKRESFHRAAMQLLFVNKLLLMHLASATGLHLPCKISGNMSWLAVIWNTLEQQKTGQLYTGQLPVVLYDNYEVPNFPCFCERCWRLPNSDSRICVVYQSILEI